MIQICNKLFISSAKKKISVKLIYGPNLNWSNLKIKIDPIQLHLKEHWGVARGYRLQ